MDPNTYNPMTPQGTPQGTPPPTPPYGAPAPVQPGGGGSIAKAAGGAIMGRLLGLIGFLVVIGLLAGGYFVYQKVVNPEHLGQIIFTTDDTATLTGCDVGHQVTSVKVGTPVYAVYILQHRLTAGQKVVEEDFKDGTSLGEYDIEPEDTSADCLADEDEANLSLRWTEPGVYEIQLRVGTEIISQGKLTITA
jgi:hypothetical protein